MCLLLISILQINYKHFLHFKGIDNEIDYSKKQRYVSLHLDFAS